MNEREHEKMYRAETRFWWFKGKGLLVSMLADRWLDLGEGDTALDLGCGTGANLERMARGRWTGIDLSGQAVAFCAQRGLSRLARAELARLPFADGSVKAASALDVIEHLDDDSAALDEIFRVLAPGGRLLVTVPAHPLLWGAHDEALGHRRRYTQKQLTGRIEQAGFRVRAAAHFMGLLLPLMALGKLAQRVTGNRRETVSYEWPGAVNSFLLSVLRAELALFRNGLPAGTTLWAVAEKPGKD